ncbi:DUF1754-domain-containing protein [Testicularia cyperi]|uniref:DUF1754-domain-containing protein n=1 Tax=Testicularia cyperi TaxID=1882483 RepID=A0A317XTH8_9BASI|nr:DUF1754-domain-containing protein [Testicularia cyperi]
MAPPTTPSSSTSSAYAYRPGGSLKFKGGEDIKHKKKKKKSKSSLPSDLKHAGPSSSSSSSFSKHKDTSDSIDDVNTDKINEAELDALERQVESKIASASSTRNMTDAERKFDEVRRKRMHEKIRKEAKTTHKDKVDAFNRYLESLTEHHDIPKVGPG